MVVTNDIQLRGFSKFYTIVLLCALTFIAAMSIDMTPIQYEPLSVSQQSKLIDKLTISGFKVLLKNGCYEPVVQYIQTSTWSDNWCATNYKYTNLTGIK